VKLTRVLFTTDCLVAVLFGVGLLATPALLLDLYGLSCDRGAAFMARLVSAGLMGHAGVLYFARNEQEKSMVAIVRGHLLFDVVGIVVSLIAVLSGAINALGWSLVVLFAVPGAIRVKIGFFSESLPG
jgi:hypothetical protein